MENICYQKQFIYDKLHNRMICDEIMNIITEYNIPRTINKNGIFINVSVLSKEVIQLLYERIQQLDINKEKNNSYDINMMEHKEEFHSIINTKKTEKRKKQKKLQLTDLQKKILSFS